MSAFTYNPIYDTSMFTCSDKLTELNRLGTEMRWAEISPKNAFWPRFKEGRELCREIMGEYENCSPNEQKMLNSRIPTSYGNSVPGFVRCMMNKFKDARDELVDIQIMNINKKLEVIEANTTSLAKINKKLEVIETNTAPSRRTGAPYRAQNNTSKEVEDDNLEL